MKNFLVLSVFAVLTTLGFYQSAMANCYCPQGQLHGNQCIAQFGYNSPVRVLSMAVCPAQSGHRPNKESFTAYNPYDEKCQTLQNNTKRCAYTSKTTGELMNVSDFNAQGGISVNRLYHAGSQSLKSEQFYDEQGRKHGTFRSYHANGKPNGIGQSVHGKLQGDFRLHDENGQLIKIEHYKDEQLILEIHYANNQKHGQEIEYGYLDGGKKGLIPYIARTAQWVNGIKHGEEKFFEATNKKGKTKLVKTVMWQNGKAIF